MECFAIWAVIQDLIGRQHRILWIGIQGFQENKFISFNDRGNPNDICHVVQSQLVFIRDDIGYCQMDQNQSVLAHRPELNDKPTCTGFK